MPRIISCLRAVAQNHGHVYIRLMNTVAHTPFFFSLIRLATRLLLPARGH
jgi:hypothetical protein